MLEPADTAEAVVGRMFRCWERNDVDAVAALFARDAIAESLVARRTIRGREAIREHLHRTLAAGTTVEVATHRLWRKSRGEVVVTGRIRVRSRKFGLKDMPARWVVRVNGRHEIVSLRSGASALEEEPSGAAAARRASGGLGTDDPEPTEWLFGSLSA